MFKIPDKVPYDVSAADEALTYGLVDKVIESRSEIAPVDGTGKKSGKKDKE